MAIPMRSAILLAGAALLTTEAPARADWYMTLNMAPTDCVDLRQVDPNGEIFSPAGMVEMQRKAGLRAQLIDKGDIVDVFGQDKNGELTQFRFYRSLDACQRNVGYLKDNAPTGSGLEKYR